MAKASVNRWTNPQDIKAQVQKLWDRGLLLKSLIDSPEIEDVSHLQEVPEPVNGAKPVNDSKIFPLRLKLKGPSSSELSERFTEVRSWIAQLSDGAGMYRIVWRQVNHRILGTNELPAEIWIDQPQAALKMIKQEPAAAIFLDLFEQTRSQLPELLPWLLRRPLRVLELSQTWPQIMLIVAWLKTNQKPNVYTRQLSLPGVHTKLIETHRATLSELLDLALPPEAIDTAFSGISGFSRRYGFRDKPMRVRFRLLDKRLKLVDEDSDQDITITATAFAKLNLDVSRIFITENEINFLAFPEVEGALIIFGAGYGFDNLAAAAWMQTREIYYWGDIDTHGFAILHQLRGKFSHVHSLLMDRQTLLDHRCFWVAEEHQETTGLVNLDEQERQLYDDLRYDRLGNHVRLEQERISYAFLKSELEKL
jgi:hypothetical protein